ncbi:MAG TPA: glycogen debranching N-terminal domain-containing protein [Gaiellaceae bacterium]|nr:glycogen debranching N-terminal domain-containing protein [Gaiellaceae bacterium]
MTLTILEGSTFCICDDLGDIYEATGGFFADDTRYLSLFRLTVNGESPLLLSSGKVEYFSAAFYLRNPLAGGLGQDSIAIIRERFVSEAMQDRIAIENVTTDPISFELALEVASDFADIFAVKEYDFALGDPDHARPLPKPVAPKLDAEHSRLVLDDPSGEPGTQVVFSRLGEVDGGSVRYRVDLEPRGRWELVTDVLPQANGNGQPVSSGPHRFGEELARVQDSLTAWQLRVPQLRATWDALAYAFSRSVSDLAALRMRGGNGGIARLPAAGMPWFMTVFGRDTIITSLQTLLFGPELARGALEVLAELQATEEDPSIDAEPGKIVHEVRHGKAAKAWFERYYGTVDATPLYLVLLSEVWRWTDDVMLARDLRDAAMRALTWIDEYGDRDGDGFVEYEKRSERGLDNQSWKDSGDSQRFADGRFATTPIAPAEVQGYVFDAKKRIAELAREAWRDRPLAERLDREADELKKRFDEAFWIEERGGYYALALDGEKQAVDSLCSNMGHLLWSGIVPAGRVTQVVDQLMGDALWSGWGVRTMSTDDRAYSPLAYHNGTVWPHDNSLIAWGLMRYARWPEAYRIVQRMLEASVFFDHELPEVFAGLPRAQTPFPIAYPTAARPQAWAAGTPVLLLQVLLGLQPDRRRQTLETLAPLEVPSWAGTLRLSGIRAFDRTWDAHLDDGRVRVEPA